MRKPETPDPTGDDLGREELYELAKEHDIRGRSRMTKDELADALQQVGQSVQTERLASRLDEFRDLAERSARGESVMLPRQLRGNDRRLHVRQTLREDHQTRIADRKADTEVKFRKLAGSTFSFFRGTALLFYRDMAGEDSWMPTVLTLGDVHPENFGVMPNHDNVPIFGVNDFDEAYYAPFTWDLKRGTTAFLLAAEEEAGYSKKRRLKIARRFVEGYIDGIREYAETGTEANHQMRYDNAPKLIQKLFEDAEESRAEWLKDDYLDEFGRGFRSDDEHVPITNRREEFQELLDGLVKQKNISIPERTGERIRVKDVCVRRGQGTASLGLPRYYLLVEGKNADGTDDLIVEFKRARRSALSGLAPSDEHNFRSHGERIAHAQTVQLVRGDVFYGSVEIDGTSFMTRERAPFRDDIDLDDLSKKHWKKYAFICGRSLAHAHALSDEVGDFDYDIEPLILKAIGPEELFIDDMLRFAAEAHHRVKRDHKAFRKDHALGAFDSVDIHFR